MRPWLLIILALALLAPGASAAWTTENADGPNTGHAESPTPDGLDGARTTDAGERIVAQVIEGPGSLAVVGTVGGELLAIDARGNVVWRVDVGAEIRSAPAWTGELVVVAPRSGEALAVDPTGTPFYRAPIGNDRSGVDLVRMASPAVLPGGDVIIGDLEGEVQRLNRIGAPVWTYSFPGGLAVEATPAIVPGSEDVIVAAFEPGREDEGLLVRLDGLTGEEEWREQINSQVVGAPTVVGQRVLVPLRDGDALESRSLQDGSLQWSRAFDDHLTASPSLHEDLAIVGDIRGVLRGIDIQDGSVAWTFSPLQNDPNVDHVGTSTATTVADGVAVDSRGRVWVAYWTVDLTQGFPPQDSTSSPFYILDADTGERQERTRFDKASHGPSLHATGVWAGSDEGIVRHWPVGGVLEIEAFTSASEVTLVTNTATRGPWSIDWGTEHHVEGSGQPPAISSRSMSRGEHTITVTVGDRSASTTVHVDADEQPVEPPASNDPSAGGEPGGPGGAGSGDTDDASAPWLAGLIAVLVVAWRRRREP